MMLGRCRLGRGEGGVACGFVASPRMVLWGSHSELSGG